MRWNCGDGVLYYGLLHTTIMATIYPNSGGGVDATTHSQTLLSLGIYMFAFNALVHYTDEEDAVINFFRNRSPNTTDLLINELQGCERAKACNPEGGTPR